MVEKLVPILQLAVMYILYFHVTTSVGYTDNVTQFSLRMWNTTWDKSSYILITDLDN